MCHKITRKLTLCNVKAKTSVKASFEYIYLKGVNVCIKTTQLSRLLAIFASHAILAFIDYDLIPILTRLCQVGSQIDQYGSVHYRLD